MPDKNRATMDEGPEDVQDFLTFRLARVQSKLNMQAAQILEKTAGLSLTQWRILALVGAAGLAKSSTLTRQAAFDKGLFSRRLKSLVEQGLVQTNSDPKDSRAQILSLTKAGRALYAKTLPVMRKRQAALERVLSDEQQDAFFDALERLDKAAETIEFGQ